MTGIIRIQQEDNYGCQVAVLAMILGVSYQEALNFYPHHPNKHNGFGSHVLETILTENRFAIAKKHKVRSGFNNEPREIWPPLPFAKLHWAQVETSAGAHAIIVLEDGTVLDPWTPERCQLSDPDYTAVNFVAAVVPF